MPTGAFDLTFEFDNVLLEHVGIPIPLLSTLTWPPSPATQGYSELLFECTDLRLDNQYNMLISDVSLASAAAAPAHIFMG